MKEAKIKSLLSHTKSRRRLFASSFCLSEYAELVDRDSKSVGCSPTTHSIVRTLFRLKSGNIFGAYMNENEE
jgi:hypothetical protein